MQIEENVALAPLTTLRIGGPARYFARVGSEAELLQAVEFARSHGLKTFALGGGSNLVVADSGFAGLVIHMMVSGLIVRSDREDEVFFDVSAGTDWDALVRHVCELGIAGMECLAGIPGLVGGAPIQNIGAYGQEVSQVIAKVRVLDLDRIRFIDMPAETCGFRYRTSRFNSTDRGRYLVTAVRFRFLRSTLPNLSYGDLASLRGTGATPLEVYHAVRAIRERKGMLLDPVRATPNTYSAGSFFKNPIVPAAAVARVAAALSIGEAQVPHWPAAAGQVKLPAAWLIEQAGFPRGFAESAESRVGISTQHTLALVNRSGTATCAELVRLRDVVAAGVEARFGVSLEQEPVMLA